MANCSASNGDAARDYYSLFALEAQMSQAELGAGLRDAARVWTRRANNAPQMEQRHEAELMLQRLAEAEAILLNPSKRYSYDEALRNQPKKSNTDTAPSSSSRTGDAYRAPLVTCPRCGLRTSVVSQFCPSCGFESALPAVRDSYEQPARSEVDLRGSDGAQTAVPAPTSPFPRSLNTGYEGPSRLDFLTFFGSRKRILTGTVIAIDPVYMAKPDPRSLLIRLAIGLLLLPIIISLAITVMMISITSSMFSSGQGKRPSFFSNIASQMFGFFLMGKLFGPTEEIPVRDVRLRDSFGREHLVRIRGELIAGNINVGDEIEVEGSDRWGTFIFERGWNKRIGAEIRARRR